MRDPTQNTMHIAQDSTGRRDLLVGCNHLIGLRRTAIPKHIRHIRKHVLSQIGGAKGWWWDSKFSSVKRAMRCSEIREIRPLIKESNEAHQHLTWVMGWHISSNRQAIPLGHELVHQIDCMGHEQVQALGPRLIAVFGPSTSLDTCRSLAAIAHSLSLALIRNTLSLCETSNIYEGFIS